MFIAKNKFQARVTTVVTDCEPSIVKGGRDPGTGNVTQLHGCAPRHEIISALCGEQLLDPLSQGSNSPHLSQSNCGTGDQFCTRARYREPYGDARRGDTVVVCTRYVFANVTGRGGNSRAGKSGTDTACIDCARLGNCAGVVGILKPFKDLKKILEGTA